ncbi:hypothetical protein CBS101457_001331 [Exobasidium rhododendri]|nr:hypothetical protein CBS101457_001331 [Exobasidium rhododendri]
MVNTLIYLVPFLALASQAVVAHPRMEKRTTCGSVSSGSSASTDNDVTSSVSASASAEIDYSFQSSFDLDINSRGVCTTFAGLDLGIGARASLGSIFTSAGVAVSSSSSSIGSATSGIKVSHNQVTQAFLETFSITFGSATCVGKGASYSSKGWKCPCSGGSAGYELYFPVSEQVTLETYASFSAMASQEFNFNFYAEADATVQVITLSKPSTSGACTNGSSCTMKYNKDGKCQG